MFKYLNIIPRSLHYNCFLIGFSFLLTSILEILAVSLIIPLLISFTDSKNFFLKYFEYINEIILKFSTENYHTLTIISLIVILYFLKNILLFFIVNVQNNFVQLSITRISKKLLNNYLNQNIFFHKKNDTASLIKKISADVQFLANLIISSFKFYSDIVILIAIFIILLLMNFILTASLAFFLSIFFFFYFFFIKKKLKTWSIKRHELYELSLKTLIETINSYKEIIIYKSKNFFVDKYYHHLYNSYDTQKKFDIYQQ